MTRTPTDPLRVLVVDPFSTRGGAERWLTGVLAATDRLTARAVLLADGPGRGLFEAAGVECSVLPTGPRPIDIARSSWALRRELRDPELDVVVANGVKAAAVAVPAARWLGVPIVWIKHDFSFDGPLTRSLGAAATAVIATSAAAGVGAGRDDVVVVPPARPALTALDRVQARAALARAGVDLTDAPVVAVVGRLATYKGIDVALRALALAPARGWNLLVVGPDDPASPGERDRLRALAAELGVGDRATFLAEIEGLPAFLPAVDAVAVLTVVDERGFGREGYSMVGLEALAAGVPLVGVDTSPEVVRMAAAGGIAVPAADPAAVADALARLEDPALRQRLGAAGRALVADHPDLSRCADDVAAVLARACGRPGAGLEPRLPVTVLTCVRNEEGHIADVAGGVLAQMGEEDEYLMLDDGSTDGTAVELAAWGAADRRVRLLHGPARGLSAARNHGFELAGNSVVVCADAGTVPRPGWLDGMRLTFQERDSADLAVGVYGVSTRGPRERAFAAAAFPSVAEARRTTPFVAVYSRLFGGAFSADRLDGRAMGVRREAWRAVGGFRTDLRSSEDAVFGHDLLARGFRSVLCLDAEVTWEQGSSWSETARTYARYGEWSARAGDWPLVSRDLARAGAYAVAPVLAARGGVARAAVVAGGLAYLSRPVLRSTREGDGPATMALLPLALAVKDLSKAFGCLRGLWARRREGGD